MKIILSRKGFDSKYGEIPNPILPDGTLLSMPIPLDDNLSYQDLSYNNLSYDDILQQLKPGFKYKKCHLDPDLRKDIIKRDKCWVASFGQSDAALSHLFNQNVMKGDIFLFFGWFKQTELYEGKLRFKPNAPDIHVIYGYLQIGDILSSYDKIKKLYWHPHANIKEEHHKRNAIFVASEKLLDTDYPGFGVFKYDKKLVLTKYGYSRSRWQLPKCFENKDISYHSTNNYKKDYFQSACIGQEFVIDVDTEVINWLKSLFLV